jgi:hypothetical protein
MQSNFEKAVERINGSITLEIINMLIMNMDLRDEREMEIILNEENRR